MRRFRSILTASAVGITAVAFNGISAQMTGQQNFQYSHINVSGQKAYDTAWQDNSDNAHNLGVWFSYTKDGQKKELGVYVCSDIIQPSEQQTLTRQFMQRENIPLQLENQIILAIKAARRACFHYIPGA